MFSLQIFDSEKTGKQRYDHNLKHIHIIKFYCDKPCQECFYYIIETCMDLYILRVWGKCYEDIEEYSSAHSQLCVGFSCVVALSDDMMMMIL